MARAIALKLLYMLPGAFEALVDDTHLVYLASPFAQQVRARAQPTEQRDQTRSAQEEAASSSCWTHAGHAKPARCGATQCAPRAAACT